jgi:hypothetical protein
MSKQQQDLVGPQDDNFHQLSADPWETETCWFSFHIPERRLAGWLYAWVRPNMGNCGGGVFIYDDTGVAPYELPYFNYQYTQPLPAERDLRDFTFPNSYSVKMLEPLQRYALQFSDRKLLTLELEFNAVAAPHPFPQGEPPFISSPHFDQPGRVTGHIVLHGERLEVDCIAVRDRTWGPRQDHRGSRLGYSFGSASAQEGFCVFALPLKLDEQGRELIYHGYLIRDGVRAQIKHGARTVERDPRTNFITRMIVEAIDEQGRALRAVGEPLARMMIPVPRGPTMNTFFKWSFDNGMEGYGEDQDVWRYDQWRAAHVAGRGEGV